MQITGFRYNCAMDLEPLEYLPQFLPVLRETTSPEDMETGAPRFLIPFR